MQRMIAGLAVLFTICMVDACLAEQPAAQPAVKKPEPPPLTHYMGREIAQTMHYTGAPWLVRESREREEDCTTMLSMLNVKQGQTVCDLGCGNGFYTLKLAKMVGPEGRVLAEEIQEEYFPMLRKRAEAEKIANIEPILGTFTDPKLPAGKIDLVLMVDVYHEMSNPEEMLAAIRKSLKAGGRLVLVEFRLEDENVPIQRLHRTSKKQLLKELVPNGFRLVGQFDGLPMQHMMFFVRDDSPVKENFQQTGRPRRFIAADYQKKIIAIVNEQGETQWQEKIQDIHDAWVLPNGNVLFQPNWTEIIEETPEKKMVWQYNAGEMNGNKGKRIEVHAFEPLGNGVLMIAESGAGRIIEVDRDGKLLKEVKLKIDKPDPHRDTRMARKLENGHYLVCHEADGAVREYDDAGNVVWEHKVGSAVFGAIRLQNGNTLITAGNGHRILEVDVGGKEVWTIEKDELPGITLAWVTTIERLPNGNTVFVNCHAGPENPQIIEVTPRKKVVWSFKDYERFGNALPMGHVLGVQTIR